MSRAYAQNPEKFSLGIARGAALGLKRTLPDGRVIVGDKAAVTDLGEALRIVVELPRRDPDRGPRHGGDRWAVAHVPPRRRRRQRPHHLLHRLLDVP